MYWVEAQADLSLCWPLSYYCRFCHALTQMVASIEVASRQCFVKDSNAIETSSCL